MATHRKTEAENESPGCLSADIQKLPSIEFRLRSHGAVRLAVRRIAQEISDNSALPHDLSFAVMVIPDMNRLPTKCGFDAIANNEETTIFLG